MQANKEYALGDQIRLKKKHPCGSFDWTIIRMGADIKIKCLGCGHLVMLSRSQFNKRVKQVLIKKTEGKGIKE